MRVVEIVVEEANGRVPVLAGAGGYDTRRGHPRRARDGERRGVSGFLSVTPYYNKPTQEGLYQHYRAFAEAPLPIIVYNVPPRTNVNVAARHALRLAEIAEHRRRQGSVGRRLADCRNRHARAGGFKVFSGDDSMTLPVVAVGGVGLISVASNEAPRQMTALTRAAIENNWDEARRLESRVMVADESELHRSESRPGQSRAH
jgi:4-hydroxy-tetrahydrodipicolinate synthase